MSFKKVLLVGSAIFSLSVNVFSSAVSFSSPQPWLTLRDKDASVKVVIDTSVTKGKSVALKAFILKKGRKTTLARKTVKGGEITADLDFSIQGNFIGGKNYIGVDWSVIGIKNKNGTLAPIGYMPLTDKSTEAIKANEVKGEFSASAFKADVSLGKSEIDFAWSEKGLIIAAKISDKDINVKLDLKNGKNAFPAFADRCVTLSKDSSKIAFQYPNRTITKDGLNYEKKEWKNDITLTSSTLKNDSKIIVVNIPWYDLGMIAQKGRKFGAAVIIEGTDNYPAKANKAIPGTWGNIELN